MQDEDIRQLARRYVRELGPNRAAALLGVGRETALSLAADAIVKPATFALIRERLAARRAPAQPPRNSARRAPAPEPPPEVA